MLLVKLVVSSYTTGCDKTLTLNIDLKIVSWISEWPTHTALKHASVLNVGSTVFSSAGLLIKMEHSCSTCKERGQLYMHRGKTINSFYGMNVVSTGESCRITARLHLTLQVFAHWAFISDVFSGFVQKQTNKKVQRHLTQWFRCIYFAIYCENVQKEKNGFTKQ